jgi:hypothetical protein
VTERDIERGIERERERERETDRERERERERDRQRISWSVWLHLLSLCMVALTCVATLATHSRQELVRHKETAERALRDFDRANIEIMCVVLHAGGREREKRQ